MSCGDWSVLGCQRDNWPIRGVKGQASHLFFILRGA